MYGNNGYKNINGYQGDDGYRGNKNNGYHVVRVNMRDMHNKCCGGRCVIEFVNKIPFRTIINMK